MTVDIIIFVTDIVFSYVAEVNLVEYCWAARVIDNFLLHFDPDFIVFLLVQYRQKQAIPLLEVLDRFLCPCSYRQSPCPTPLRLLYERAFDLKFPKVIVQPSPAYSVSIIGNHPIHHPVTIITIAIYPYQATADP